MAPPAGGGLSWFMYVYCTTTTIAVILGSGLLALPVRLWRAGFAPFQVLFVTSLFAQGAIVALMVELLQRARAISSQNKIGLTHTIAMVSFADDESGGGAGGEEDEKGWDADWGADWGGGPTSGTPAGEGARTLGGDDDDGSTSGEEVQLIDVKTNHSAVSVVDNPTSFLTSGPSLHLLGELYLSAPGRAVFSFAVSIHFQALLISYALAGSQSLCALAGCRPTFLVIPFVCVFGAMVVFLFGRVQQMLTILTCVKVVLLVAMIAVVGYIGSRVREHNETHWDSIGSPYLLSTLALGGVANIMPVLFAKVPQERRAVVQFRRAVWLGVALCWAFNIVWAYFVLEVVPQRTVNGTCSDAVARSLECANEKGQISTEPVVEIIRTQFPHLLWMSDVVATFILLSIAVSFTAMSCGMKHQIDGFIRAKVEGMQPQGWLNRIAPRNPTVFLQALLYGASFGTVMLVATLNPASFFLVLEIVGSMSLNLETGVFIAMMFHVSRRHAVAGDVPMALGERMGWALPVCAGAYFCLAVLYDIVVTVAKYVPAPGSIIVLTIAGVIVAAGLGWWLLSERNVCGRRIVEEFNFDAAARRWSSFFDAHSKRYAVQRNGGAGDDDADSIHGDM